MLAKNIFRSPSFRKLTSKVASQFGVFPLVRHAVIELKDVQELMKLFHWNQPPQLDDASVYQTDRIEDVNERLNRDAEVIGCIMRNTRPACAIEIGTLHGVTTALMAMNSPESNIKTVNILPEDVVSGAGGDMTTVAITKDDIGSYFRARNYKNIEQIYANTAVWTPKDSGIDKLNFAFIDGCHDAEFVYNDTRKLLQHMPSGSFVLWHDFNLEQVWNHRWVWDVCMGVEQLMAAGLIWGRIFHVRDSVVGIYRVP